MKEQNSTLTNTISHIETIGNTVTSFYSNLLVLIPVAQDHNQIHGTCESISFLNNVQ